MCIDNLKKMDFIQQFTTHYNSFNVNYEKPDVYYY